MKFNSSQETPGNIEFYRTILSNGNTYREMAVVNILQITPRDRSQAQKLVRLTDITTKDVICWYTRKADTLLELEDPRVREEKRPGFDPFHPEAYEVSRVQVNKKHRYEKTRQAMCMFCQTPTFFGLFGRNGLLFHTQHAHPHEVPQFVLLLMAELNLLPERRKHSSCDVFDDSPELKSRWPDLEYLDDGVTNQLRFAPRPGLEQTEMRLAEVSEKVLMPWFERNPEDFQNHKHSHIKWIFDTAKPESVKHLQVSYRLKTDFDPTMPSVYQLRRFVSDESDPGLASWCSQFACMYCQEPDFRYMHGCGGLLSHFAAYHWPNVSPSVEEVQQAKYDLAKDGKV